MFFKRKKKLRELNLESLSDRQGALMLELLLVNRELVKRYRVLVDLAKDMSSAEETIAVLGGGADRYARLNAMLEAEIHVAGIQRSGFWPQAGRAVRYRLAATEDKTRRPFPRIEGLHCRSLPEARPAETSDVFRTRRNDFADLFSMQPGTPNGNPLISLRFQGAT